MTTSIIDRRIAWTSLRFVGAGDGLEGSANWGRLEHWSGDLLVPEEGQLGARLDSAGFASVIGVLEAVDSVFGLRDVGTESQAFTRSTGEVQSVSRGGCIGEPWNPVDCSETRERIALEWPAGGLGILLNPDTKRGI